MDTMANRIKEAMQLRNIKQSELVEKIGIGKSSISTYISGSYEPKQRNIYKIAKALDVNESWLMGNDVPMERKSFYVSFDDSPVNRGLQKIQNSEPLNDEEKEAVKEFIPKAIEHVQDTFKQFDEKLSDIYTIAAHLDGDEYTQEELEEINQFAEFVKNRKKK